MGLHGSKETQKIPPPQRQKKNLKQKVEAKVEKVSAAKRGADDVKKAKSKSAKKVQKLKVLQAVPPKIFDTEVRKGKSGVGIREAAKEDVIEDKTPLYRPDLPKPTPIDLPIQFLKEKFGMSKSEGQQKSDLTRQGLDPALEKQENKVSDNIEQNQPLVKRKSMFLSSPRLKEEMAARKNLGGKKLGEEKKKKAGAVAAPRLLENKLESEKLREELLPLVKTLESKTQPLTLALIPKGAQTEKPKTEKKESVFKNLEGHFGFRRLDLEGLKKEETTGVKEFLNSDGGTIGKNVLKVLRQAVHDGGGDLQKLIEFGIPDQHQLFTLALASDKMNYDFGGLVNHYHSFILRNYIPTNRLDRYRGMPPTSQCLTEVDITRLETKETFRVQDKMRRYAIRDKELSALLNASFDETHFEFLKELATNQSVSIPLTLIHDIAKEVLPMINHMQACKLQVRVGSPISPHSLHNAFALQFTISTWAQTMNVQFKQVKVLSRC